jgi:hypothetical protein
MNAKRSTQHKFGRVLPNILSVLAILAIALPVTQVAYAASSSPFVGYWQATDIDGSDIRLSIGGPPGGPFQITWTESYISFCDGEAGIVRGTGQLNESDPNLLEADLHLECFTTGASMDFLFAWRYHPLTNTLSSRYENGVVTIWYRPGRPQPPPPVLGLRVNYGHDWVESFYEGGHMAWVTVTESDGVTVKATAELVTEPKDYWGGETGFQSLDSIWFDANGNPMENPPDIQPDDWVFAWADNGASAQVQIGEISGEIDLAADSIQGTINAPWIMYPVQVECLDWGSGGEPFSNKDGGLVLTNGADPYSCSWAGEWNIQPGQTVGVGYFGLDGHWVANAFFVINPTFVAYVPGAIEGYDWPMGNTITIIVNDGEYTAQAISEQRPESPEGSTRVLFELWRNDFSIEAGDQIMMTDGVVRKEVVVTNLAVTDFDLNAGTVSGVYDPAYSLWVWLYDLEGQVPETDTDNGTWVATFTELPLGAWGGATQWDIDGDGTSIDFQVPESILWVAAYTYDVGTWSEGQHSYHFEAAWNGGSETTPEVLFNVSNSAPSYNGYVLLRGLALRANSDGTCPVIDPLIRPDQLTRFHTGYVTDYPMTYAEALTYFDSLTAKIVWDGGQPVELVRHEIIPFREDEWPSYYCTFTQ